MVIEVKNRKRKKSKRICANVKYVVIEKARVEHDLFGWTQVRVFLIL